MMTDVFALLLALAGGGLLGGFYFGGLRWTVRRGLASPAAAAWFAGSFLLRSAICLVGFYWIGAAHPLRLVACLGGFIVARMIVTKLTDDDVFASAAETSEPRHAP